MDVYSDVDGYLLIADDALFFHWNVDFSRNLDKIWYRKHTKTIDSIPVTYDLKTRCHNEWGMKTLANCQKAQWPPIRSEQVQKSALKAMDQMKQSNVPVLNECYDILARKNGGEYRINYEYRIADVFYIPAKVKREFQFLSRVFARNSLAHALFLPTISQCLVEYSGLYLLPGLNDQKSRSDLGTAPWDVIHKVLKLNLTHVHPYKMSSVLSNKRNRFFSNKKNKHKDYFCDELIPLFYSH